jgi:polysaccharide export outer membrane protein
MQRLAVTAFVFGLTASATAWGAVTSAEARGAGALAEAADQQVGPSTSVPEARPHSAESARTMTPAGYVIGPEDVLTILFWSETEKKMSGDFIVRPDGKISMSLLNDIQAAGLTPDELRLRINEEASRYIEDPNATVVVKQINSRKVFITGEVEKPGPYLLAGPMTVLQLIANAGGFKEYAKREAIVIMRSESGRQVQLAFDYNAVVRGKKLQQNVELKPGDTVVVP